jgi:hypothetical protein
MRKLTLAAWFVWVVSAQTVVDPANMPAAAKLLEYHEGEKALRCDVDHSKAELNFGMRFQAGYILGVPLVQYSRTGNSWQIALRITPDGGEPTYLTDRFDLPGMVDDQYTGQMPGTFLLGEGRYQVEFAAIDGQARVCRKEWRLDAAIGRGDRAVKVAIPRRTVAGLSWNGSAAGQPETPGPRRLTVLLNGSKPYQPWVNRFQQVVVPHTAGPEIETPMDYRSALIGILASLLEKLPGTAVRLVVFDLDQGKETLRQDSFTLKDIDKAAHAADSTEHWVVTVHELQNQLGPWGLLAKLIRSEMLAPEPSDAVLILGPRMAPLDQMPAHLFEALRGPAPRFFYMQYRLSANPVFVGVPSNLGPNQPNTPPSLLPDGPLTPEVSDPIDLLITRLKGKTLMLHSPVEFAKAVETIKR